jgi:hypothetical protein
MERESLFFSLTALFHEFGPAGIWSALLLGLAISAVLAWLLIAAVRRRTRFYLPVFAAILAAVALAVFGELYRSHRAWSDRNLSSIQLLPGYTLNHGRGDDSYGGSISRSDGSFQIGIDIGGLSGVWADPGESERYEWIIEHHMNGRKVWIALLRRTLQPDPAHDEPNTTEERELIVTFPSQITANFSAVVRSERETAEMLSMVLTYVPIR